MTKCISGIGCLLDITKRVRGNKLYCTCLSSRCRLSSQTVTAYFTSLRFNQSVKWFDARFCSKRHQELWAVQDFYVHPSLYRLRRFYALYLERIPQVLLLANLFCAILCATLVSAYDMLDRILLSACIASSGWLRRGNCWWTKRRILHRVSCHCRFAKSQFFSFPVVSKLHLRSEPALHA